MSEDRCIELLAHKAACIYAMYISLPSISLYIHLKNIAKEKKMKLKARKQNTRLKK